MTLPMTVSFKQNFKLNISGEEPFKRKLPLLTDLEGQEFKQKFKLIELPLKCFLRDQELSKKWQSNASRNNSKSQLRWL